MSEFQQERDFVYARYKLRENLIKKIRLNKDMTKRKKELMEKQRHHWNNNDIKDAKKILSYVRNKDENKI